MSTFTEYTPNFPHGASRAVDYQIAQAQLDDLEAIAAITAQREGGTPQQHLQAIETQFGNSPEHCQLFVAFLDSDVVAFARVSRLETSSIPEGWYLLGMIITPSHRRKGIGAALTKHRLQWLASRTNQVFYFANTQNLASIDLHAAFGFQEIQRGISVSGCSFEGGVGTLYSIKLSD